MYEILNLLVKIEILKINEEDPNVIIETVKKLERVVKTVIHYD